MTTTYQLVEIKMSSFIEPIRVGRRNNSLIQVCAALFSKLQHNWLNKLTSYDINQSEIILESH